MPIDIGTGTSAFFVAWSPFTTYSLNSSMQLLLVSRHGKVMALALLLQWETLGVNT